MQKKEEWESVSEDVVIAYHGTSQEKANQIEKEGFTIASDETFIKLTEIENVARVHAKDYGNNSVILKCAVKPGKMLTNVEYFQNRYKLDGFDALVEYKGKRFSTLCVMDPCRILMLERIKS